MSMSPPSTTGRENIDPGSSEALAVGASHVRATTRVLRPTPRQWHACRAPRAQGPYRSVQDVARCPLTKRGRAWAPAMRRSGRTPVADGRDIERPICSAPTGTLRRGRCQDVTVVDAVIFDLDDTLIVEEDTARAALAEALTSVGAPPMSSALSEPYARCGGHPRIMVDVSNSGSRPGKRCGRPSTIATTPLPPFVIGCPSTAASPGRLHLAPLVAIRASPPTPPVTTSPRNGGAIP